MNGDASTLRERLGDFEDRGDGEPLYEALAERVASLVADGELPAGTRLPSERRLAAALGVSRGTVIAAYDRLRADGVVTTRHGSGTVVRPEASPVTGPRESHVAAALASQSIWAGVLAPDQTIDLRGAYWVGTRDLPMSAFSADGADAAALLGGHGYEPLGIPALRAAIAGRLTEQGLPSEPEQVLVTSGAQQALTLVAELLIGPDDWVVTEELTFPGALDAFVARQARIRTAPLTPHGVDVGRLARVVADADPRIVYLMPDCHNPTGVTMPSIARRRLAELAAGWSGVVVDDRTLVSTGLRDTPASPPVAAYAQGSTARVLTVGSVSKAFWGGLRVGWIRGPRSMIARLARLKLVDDLGTSALSQLVACRLLDAADEILPRRRAGMVERHGVLVDALHERLTEWTWTDPPGGLCLWVHLPRTDTAAFSAVAARHGVGVAPGTVNAPGGGWRDHLRLPYGQPPEVLEEAVARLADAWTEYRRGVDRTDRLDVVV